METLKLVYAGVFLCFACSVTKASAAQTDLYGEATQAMLDRSFASQRVEYVLYDLQTNRVEAMRWARSDEPMPVGSLLKPFVAIAYAQLQKPDTPAFPIITCHGTPDGCWRREGHGSMTLERAIGESCNAYFLALARSVAGSDEGRQAIERVAGRYGLPAPVVSADASLTARELIGLTAAWRMTPATLARAYATLLTGPSTPVTERIREGMLMAAEATGTASHVGRHYGGVLAKTGTAPCVASAAESCAVDGDGLVVVAFPAEEPTQLLLVRVRSTTGAEAAATAGAMLSVMEKSNAASR